MISANPPIGWKAQVNTGQNHITWTGDPNVIAPTGSQDFTWVGDAPIVGSPTVYYHIVTTRDAVGPDDVDPDVSTTVNPAAEFPLGLTAVFVAGLLVYIFSGRLQ